MKTRYSRHQARTSGNTWLLIAFVIALVIFALAITSLNALAYGYGGKSEGCHTYNVNGLFGGRDNQEAVFCGDVSQVPAPKQQEQQEESTSITVTPPDDKPAIDPPANDPPKNDTPPTNEGKVKKDKHPNNGKGNGQEGDPDCDPNVNPHANDND